MKKNKKSIPSMGHQFGVAATSKQIITMEAKTLSKYVLVCHRYYLHLDKF